MSNQKTTFAVQTTPSENERAKKLLNQCEGDTYQEKLSYALDILERIMSSGDNENSSLDYISAAKDCMSNLVLLMRSIVADSSEKVRRIGLESHETIEDLKASLKTATSTVKELEMKLENESAACKGLEESRNMITQEMEFYRITSQNQVEHIALQRDKILSLQNRVTYLESQMATLQEPCEDSAAGEAIIQPDG